MFNRRFVKQLIVVFFITFCADIVITLHMLSTQRGQLTLAVITIMITYMLAVPLNNRFIEEHNIWRRVYVGIAEAFGAGLGTLITCSIWSFK